MERRIPPKQKEKILLKKRNEETILIGVEEKKKEEEILDPKLLKEKSELEKLKGSLTFNVFILFLYKLIAIVIYIFILSYTFDIKDVDLLNKHKNFFLLDIPTFLVFENIFIFIIHFINLFLLDKFFHKIRKNKEKIEKFGKKSIVKRFSKNMEENDFVKFLIYFINIFLPLLIMLYISFKVGKLHIPWVYIVNTILIILGTISVIFFLIRNIETFDFGRKLDVLIWSILYITFLIFILYAFLIYFSLNMEINSKKAYITYSLLMIISILLLIFMSFILSKKENILNLGAIFLPIIIALLSTLITAVNFIFVVMDNYPQNERVVSYLIPKLEIVGKDFNHLYKDNYIPLEEKIYKNKIFISFSGITEKDKKNFLLKNFYSNVYKNKLISSSINISKGKLNLLKKISSLLYFNGLNFKYDKFLNIYAELTTLKNIKLDFASLDYSILNYSNFDNVRILDGSLTNIDFRYSILKNVNFSFSDLSNTDFSYSILINPVFTGSNLYNVNFKYTVLINPVFIGKKGIANLENSNWENTIVLFPKVCYKNKCIDLKKIRQIETSLIILDKKSLHTLLSSKDSISKERVRYLNELSDWYKRLKSSLKNLNFEDRRIISSYFLYVLNILKKSSETQNIRDGRYKININYSSNLILQDFKNYIQKNNIFKLKKSSFTSFLPEEIINFSLNEKQKNGLIILLTIIIMGTAICYFCKKANV